MSMVCRVFEKVARLFAGSGKYIAVVVVVVIRILVAILVVSFSLDHRFLGRIVFN